MLMTAKQIAEWAEKEPGLTLSVASELAPDRSFVMCEIAFARHHKSGRRNKAVVTATVKDQGEGRYPASTRFHVAKIG